MANDPNDMTDGATSSESAATQRARRRAIEGDAPPSAAEIGKAIAAALDRNRDRKDEEKPLGEFVRASVRCGYETIKRDDKTMVTQAKSITFNESETADGTRVTVPHGRPVRLKRDAFNKHRANGDVVLAQ